MATDLGFVPDAPAGTAAPAAVAPTQPNSLGFVPDSGSPQNAPNASAATAGGQDQGVTLDNAGMIPTLFPAGSSANGTEQDTLPVASLKTLGNVPGSTFNFGVGIAKQPVQWSVNAAKIPGEFGNTVEAYAGANSSIDALAVANQTLQAQITKDKAAGRDTSRLEKQLQSNNEFLNNNKHEISPTLSAVESVANELPKAFYETLIPEGTRALISAGAGLIKNLFGGGNGETENQNAQAIIAAAANMTDLAQKKAALAKAGQLISQAYQKGTQSAQSGQQIGMGLSKAQTSVEENPAGNILPYLLLGREAMYKVSPEMGAAFDEGITKVASPVIKAGEMASDLISKAAGKTVGGASTLGRFAVGQATGLEPKTISTIVENPGEFTKANMATIDRPTVAAVVKDALDARIADLEETGKGYSEVRKSTAPIPVATDYLKTTIESTTGLKVGGAGTAESPYTLSATGNSSIRMPGDISALQNKILNVWGPEFAKGYLTPNEFLNFRSDLGSMAKYEGGIGRSTALQNLSDVMRGKFNTKYRAAVPGLAESDANFASQASELKNLKAGILDKNGELTDASINKIANASNKGRTVQLSKLEEISPGITKRIQILKAVEDIENAGGQKVGTYSRAILSKGGLLYGVVTGNLPLVAGAIAEMIASSPSMAVPLMRIYGYNKALWAAVADRLKSGAAGLNQLPEGAPPLQSVIPKAFSSAGEYLKENPPGLTMKDVSGKALSLDENGTPIIPAEKPGGLPSLADPVEGGTYYHGTTAANKSSILKNGINNALNSKGFSESPNAFYVGAKGEAGMYSNGELVGIRVKPGETVKTLGTDSQEWADTAGYAIGADAVDFQNNILKQRGYDAINHGDEIEILNPDKFEAFNPASIQKAPELFTEAQKYKTAEEFVKAKATLKHRSITPDIKTFEPNEKGIFFTKDAYGERAFGKGDVHITDAYVDLKNPLLANRENIIKLYKENYGLDQKTAERLADNFEMGLSDERQQIRGFASSGGYDGMIIPKDWDGGFGTIKSVVAFDPKQIYTKSQLTDIWNSANKKSLIPKKKT